MAPYIVLTIVITPDSTQSLIKITNYVAINNATAKGKTVLLPSTHNKPSTILTDIFRSIVFFGIESGWIMF